MLLGTSPGVAADALLSRGGVNVAARPSPSAVSPRRRGEPFRGFPALSSSPSETGSAFGGTPGSHSHGSSARRYRAERRASPSPALAPAVVGFDLDARSSEAASRSSVRQGSSVKVSALRLGSPGAEVASPADATARGDADSKHAAPPIASRSPASPGGLARGLSAMRDELETLAPKPPRHRASPTKPEGRSGCDGFELADDTVEYYAARLEALAPLTSAERGDFDALYAAYPEAFGERDARDAFALAATRLRDTKRHVYTRALETSRVLAGLYALGGDRGCAAARRDGRRRRRRR